MAKEKEVKYDFSEETIKKRRRFPVGKTILLSVFILLQLLCVAAMFIYTPKPQDVIDKYEVFVTPKDDGTLDIEYRFTWTPLDPSEPLSFVYVGVPNPDYTILEYSANITKVEEYRYDGVCHVDLHLDRDYYKGETLQFYLRINQASMLCEGIDTYFYEFIPCWFNATPVTEYSFHWKKTNGEKYVNADTSDKTWHIWQGSMEPGEYRIMRLEYEPFDATVTEYMPFDDSEVSNELKSEKGGMIAILVMVVLIIIVFEVFLVDSVISYHRGRGFITGYGHPMYVY